MLPYKIRKPVYSGASKHFQPKTSVTNNRAGGQDVSTTDADRLEKLAKDDPRLIGGNLQKAILLDLIDLRELFLQGEMSASPSNIDHAKLPSVGTSFLRFKATFKDRRFGAIHTRAIPRNVDRGEYAQLLYSCCFNLLEDSVETEGDMVIEKNKFYLPNSIFAVFVLFTLYQTNPLPSSPPTRQFTPKTKRGIFDEDALLEAWSVLPISREDQHLHRKSYKCPVRIDRKNYFLLMQLSDVCKEIVSQSANASSSYYSLAQDASHIIDKMLFTDNFFSYCEYHGPVGLEGLAGNPHFYKEHFVKQKKKPKKNKSRRVETASSQLTQDKLDKMKNDDHLSTILNVSDLSNLIDKHKSNLQNITVQLQKSRLPGGDLQPKQRELVEQTLGDITSSQQAYFDMTAEFSADYNTITSTASKDNDKAKMPDSNESERDKSPQLILPDSFSSDLRVNISEALADLKDIVTSVRNSVKEEMKAINTSKEKVLIDTSTSVVTGAQGGNKGQSLSDILAFFDVHSESSDVEEANKEVNINVNVEDDMSLATGAGKNALETLLKMAEDQIGSTHSEDDAVSRSSDDSIQMDSTKMDDSSLATGSGMKALQNLLSQTADDSIQQPTKRSEKTAKKKSLSSSGRQKRKWPKRVATKVAEEDDISVATGAGKNALSSLLKMADDTKESNHSESNSVASDEPNRTDNMIMDESSVATGVGMKALKNLLSQTTTGEEAPNKRKAKRRRHPPKATKSATKPVTSRKKKRQKTNKDLTTALQEHADDGEESLSKSTALEISRQDEISVASTTAAGKDALAALLSRVENVEEV